MGDFLELNNDKVTIRFNKGKNKLTLFNIDNISLKDKINQIIKEPQHVEDRIRDIVFSSSPLILELQNRKEIIAAANVANYLFETTRMIYSFKTTPSGDKITVPLWYLILENVWKFEKKTESYIHKGTAYFYGAELSLGMNDIDTAFNYLNQAIQEDKKLEGFLKGYPKIGPAFLTASLIKNPNNRLSWYVDKLIIFLEEHIKDYQSSFTSSFDYTQLKNKFLEKDEYESLRFAFVYSIARFNKIKALPQEELLINDFSTILVLNLMLGFGVIIDNLLSLIGEKTIFKNSISLCEKFKWSTEDEMKKLSKIYKLKGKNFDKTFYDLLKFNEMEINGKVVSKEAGLLTAARNFRNLGAHLIENKKILIGHYKEILSIMLQCIFLLVERIL